MSEPDLLLLDEPTNHLDIAAITCTIPATSKLKHLVDNMGAGVGALPDAKTRERMARFFAEF